MAIYGGQPPSDYYARQDARKDDKFRDIINLFLTLNQNKRQKEQFGQQQDLQERKFQQERSEWPTMKQYYEGRTEDMKAGPGPTTMMRDLQEIRRMFPEADEPELFRIYGERSGPSAYSEKLAYATDILKLPPKQAGYFAGGTPPKEPTKSRTDMMLDNMFRSIGTELGKGTKPEEPGYEGPKGSPQRNAGIKTVDKFYEDTPNSGDPKKYLKKRFGGEIELSIESRPITETGLYLDMPRKYNYAIFARDNKVASAEDLDFIRKYDDMFKFFSEIILPTYPTFKEFMKTDVSRDSDMDIRQMKDWYDLYGK